MKLYHASIQERTIGEIISTNDFVGDTTYYYQNLASAQKDIENKLEEKRPKEYCSRKKAVFLFDKPLYCYYFAKKQYPNQHVYVYEVESNDSIDGFPMCLIHTAYKKYYNGKPYDYIINEYWHPSKKWQVLEYLALSVSVIKECQEEDNECIARMHYENDCQQAEQIKNI